MRKSRSLGVCVVLAMVSAAAAVTPASFLHTTEADFSRGQMKSVVATSLGELTLSRQVQVLMPHESAPAVVSSLAVADKAVYAGSGAHGVIYRVEGGKSAKFAETPSSLVSSLLWTGKELLAGTGGKEAGIYRVDDKGAVKRLWTEAKVKYVWAMVRDEKGRLYAATGPEATVFAVDPDGKAQALYQADAKLAKNFLCLALGKDGLLYAGTDQSGLVFEINAATKTGRIILDADEKEVSSLLADGRGGLYAATSEAAKASPEGTVAPSPDKTGRSDGPTTTTTPAPKPATAPAKEPAPATSPATKPASGSEKPTSTPTAGTEAGKTAPTTSSGGGKSPKGTVSPDEIAALLAARSAAAAPSPAARITRVVRPPEGETVAPTPAGPPTGTGNAVYYIRPDGLVNTIFRRPVTILSMVLYEGKLILGTGNGGKVYSVATDGDEIAQIADTDARQVTALAVGEAGIVFGTANKGSVGLLQKGFAKEGTFTSDAMDARQMAKWGNMKFAASVPAGGKLTVCTRSGNVAEPEDKTWSQWSKEQPVEDGGFLPISSPAGRFLQYRLKFASADQAAPSLRQAQIIYQVGNLAPQIAAVQVMATVRGKEAAAMGAAPPPSGGQEPEGPKLFRWVLIRASDFNNDRLSYTVAYREVGTQTWITVAEKLAEPRYIWDTRTVGDGTYELRATVSDSPSNPPESALEASRISDPVLVDNTPPVVKALGAKADGTKASVSGSAADASSQITSIHYSVDSATEWVAVLPKDGICDDKKEDFDFEVKDLKPGSHRIAVKVEDAYGNVGYGSVTVTVAK